MRSSDTAIVAGHAVVAAGSADGRIHYDVVATVVVEVVERMDCREALADSEGLEEVKDDDGGGGDVDELAVVLV